jgi:hypothetical protein
MMVDHDEPVILLVSVAVGLGMTQQRKDFSPLAQIGGAKR